MTSILTSISICLAAFVGLLWILRRDQQSLGLPIAYFFVLLLNHVPGAIAHAFSSGFFYSEATEIGIWLTAVGSACFLTGVSLVHLFTPRARAPIVTVRKKYWYFCVIVGWVSTYALSIVAGNVGLAVVVENTGMIWMLGVMLGLRAAAYKGDYARAALWLVALMVYPSTVLVLGGFLSYGSIVIMIVLSVLAISVRSNWRVAIGFTVIAFLGFNLFLSYFMNRNEIRASVWGGATLETRLDRISRIVTEFELFDPTDARHLVALDARLNQNNFVGLNAMRLQQGAIDYRYGETLLNGLIQLIPRALWPGKPTFGGSNDLVAEMTGLELSKETSWGVGNVMEFYANFGMPGVIGGFLGLGWLLGWLDRRAALAEARGDLGKVFLFFLPAVALIQPIGSVAEIVGSAGAALAGGFAWKWVWEMWTLRAAKPAKPSRNQIRPGRDVF
jgi:hypothetical protein